MKKITGPTERREIVKYAIATHRISIKRSCGLFNLARSLFYNEPKRSEEKELITKLLQLAREHIRWGFNKMYQTIRNEGYPWNHKKVRRVYCELGLNLRKKPKKRLPTREAKTLFQPSKANYCWSLDFMSDALRDGQKFRTFNVIDDFNREGLGIMVGRCLPASCITNYLDFIGQFRGYPEFIRVDNGTEFLSREFVRWTTKHQITINYIQPGKPAQNAYIERFNRTYREEVLDIYLFETVAEAQKISDEWLFLICSSQYSI